MDLFVKKTASCFVKNFYDSTASILTLYLSLYLHTQNQSYTCTHYFINALKRLISYILAMYMYMYIYIYI